MTPAEAKQVIAMCIAAKPTPAVSIETLRLWAELIVDLDHATASACAMDWFRSNEQRLEPYQLRRLVAATQATAADSPYLDPDEAWAHVEWAITTVGGYRDFPDTHPLVAETVRAIGWRTLCQSDNPVADRAHFLQLYRARLERARRDDAATPGAVPHAAMGERPSVVHRAPQSIEQRATGADARALVASVAESIGRRTLPAPPVVIEAKPEPEIDDPAELARREARRRELLGRSAPAHDAPCPEARP